MADSPSIERRARRSWGDTGEASGCSSPGFFVLGRWKAVEHLGVFWALINERPPLED